MQRTRRMSASLLILFWLAVDIAVNANLRTVH